MADGEGDRSAVADTVTASTVESPTMLTAEIGVVADDVFANGDDENATTNANFLHAGYGSGGDQILPRKSSLIKDSSRGSRRKKTVSFSSMPGERTVVNGKCYIVFLFTNATRMHCGRIRHRQ